MKRYRLTLAQKIHQISLALTAMLFAGFLASCSESLDSDGTADSENAYLNLCFSTTSSTTSRVSSPKEASSRAGKAGAERDDKSPANPAKESDIHSIKVWVFKSGTGEEAQPIAFKNERTTDANGNAVNESYKLSIRFLRKTNGSTTDNIDLYILANSESINLEENLKGKDLSNLKRKELSQALFSNPFGIKSNGNAETTEVSDEKGLPISRAITNISVEKYAASSETAAASKGINIPLTRAVSKLHFFFARKDDETTHNVEVTKIELDGNMIPTASYVFPKEESYNEALGNQNATQDYAHTTQYEAKTLQLSGVGTSQIATVANPVSYKRNNTESATDYLARLQGAGIQAQDLCYLRETNKAVTGKIYYKLSQSGAEKCESFTIPSTGQAIRNRELLVYGYFEKGEMGKLNILPQVMNWQEGGSYNFNEKASSDVIINGGDQTDWGYKVYYGDPKRGPMITLKDIDTDGKTWILQTDNPMFGFVECDKNGNYQENEPIYDTQVEINENKIIGYTYKINDYLMNTTGEKKTIRFYVVPKRRLDTSMPHNTQAKVFITKNPADLFYINIDNKFIGDAQHIYFEQVL